jgi:hypothetical protein
VKTLGTYNSFQNEFGCGVGRDLVQRHRSIRSQCPVRVTLLPSSAAPSITTLHGKGLDLLREFANLESLFG